MFFKFSKYKIFRSIVMPFIGLLSPVEPKKIAFVIRKGVPFSGNVRIFFDYILRLSQDDDFQLIIYKEDAAVNVGAPGGVRIYSSYSFEAMVDISSAAIIILGHSARDAKLSRRRTGQRIINLWHGVAIKRIEHLMRIGTWSYKSAKRRFLMRRNSRLYDAMIASSETDRLVNSMAFGVELDKIHVTGLPRFDYLSPEYNFPKDLASDIDKLDDLLAGRKLVLYAPTFREVGPSALAWLQPDAVAELINFLRAKNLVLGIRPHPYDQKALNFICDGVWIIDLRPDDFAEPAILLRAASAIIVDYSSIWVDYLLLKRPIIGFMPDMSNYLENERGFIYDFPRIFPGEILNNWCSVLQAIEQLDGSGFQISAADRQKHAYADTLLLPPPDLRFRSTEACMRAFFTDLSTDFQGSVAKQ